MSSAQLTILGSNSAVPAYDRMPTSQVLELGTELILIDCGEGTQMQMQQYHIKRSRINHIFISHLHGDHYFGLIGLITSYGLMGRQADLHIYAPPGLKAIIDIQLAAGSVVLPYVLHVIDINSAGLILATNKIRVHAFETNHRITCYGFRFEEVKNKRKIDKVQCLKYEIPEAYYRLLQLGNDYENKQGITVKNEWVTTAAEAGKTYAFCADSKYDERIVPEIANVDLLYHETTYLHDLAERAIERFHSTTVHAATIAKLAVAKQLVVGHFSSKYADIEPFLEECAAVFQPVVLAKEGLVITF